MASPTSRSAASEQPRGLEPRRWRPPPSAVPHLGSGLWLGGGVRVVCVASWAPTFAPRTMIRHGVAAMTLALVLPPHPPPKLGGKKTTPPVLRRLDRVPIIRDGGPPAGVRVQLPPPAVQGWDGVSNALVVCVLTWAPGGKIVCPYSVQGKPYTDTYLTPLASSLLRIKQFSTSHKSKFSRPWHTLCSCARIG